MKKFLHKNGVILAVLAGSVWMSLADPVTFNVNMSVQTAMGNFSAVGGDTVWLMGLGEDWTNGISMAESSTPEIFTVSTNLAVSSWPNYKFVIKPAAGSWRWEDLIPNRFFQVPAGGTNLPVVYFDNITNAPTGPVDITFQLNMQFAILQGQFTMGSDYVSAFGSFDNWGTTGVLLTNVTGTSNYVGTLTTSSVPTNTVVQYKYAINGYGGKWEGNVGPNGAQNRSFTLTNSQQVLPFDYWNNVTSIIATNLIGFQVNMTVEDALGRFTPGVNTVFATGDWDWSGAALQLSQVGTSDVYTGAVLLTYAPGSAVNYKFTIDGGLTWENDGVGPNGARNRQFTMNTATNLPLVYFNNTSNLGPLFISRSGNDTTLSWPAGTNVNNRVRLQSSGSLSGWSDVLGSQGQSAVTNNFGPGPMFFRLIGP